MRINFGRADIFMAEHSLHRTQIDVMIKQMGRKRMAQNMRGYPSRGSPASIAAA